MSATMTFWNVILLCYVWPHYLLNVGELCFVPYFLQKLQIHQVYNQRAR